MEQLARLALHGIGNPQPSFSTMGVELARGSTIDAASTVDIDHFNGGWQLTRKDFRDASDKAAE